MAESVFGKSGDGGSTRVGIGGIGAGEGLGGGVGEGCGLGFGEIDVAFIASDEEPDEKEIKASEIVIPVEPEAEKKPI